MLRRPSPRSLSKTTSQVGRAEETLFLPNLPVKLVHTPPIFSSDEADLEAPAAKEPSEEIGVEIAKKAIDADEAAANLEGTNLCVVCCMLFLLLLLHSFNIPAFYFFKK